MFLKSKRVQLWAELNSSSFIQLFIIKDSSVLLSKSDGLWLSCVTTHYLYVYNSSYIYRKSHDSLVSLVRLSY